MSAVTVVPWWTGSWTLAGAAAATALLVVRSIRRTRRLRLRRVRDDAWLVDSPPSSARRRLIVSAVTAVAALIATTVSGPFAVIAVVVAPLTVRSWRRVRASRSVLAEARRQLPDAVDVIVLGIRAGLTPATAFAELSHALPPQLASYFAEASLLHRHGERFADALTVLRAAPGDMLRPLATALARAERYGEPLAPVLDRLADEARRERRRQSETSARQLPVRMCFPLACCTLPAFVLLTIVPLLAGTLTSIRGNLP